MSVGNKRYPRLRTTAVYGLLLVLAATFLLPLVWMLIASIRGPHVDPTSFKTGTPTLDHYRLLFEELPFARFYVNSVLVACVVTFGHVFTSSLAGYAFARLEFPGRNKIFLTYLATLMIPGAVVMIPQFMIITKMPLFLNGLFRTTYFTDELFFFGRWYAGAAVGVDSYFTLTVPLLFSAYGTFMLRQFFLGIPRELDEAAMIDGCSRFQIYRWIILPMAKPALATLATFTFLGCWRNFMWPLVMTNSPEMKTLPVGLASLMGMYQSRWPELMAGAMLGIIPLIVVFIMCQRYFVKGIQLGAVKG